MKYLLSADGRRLCDVNPKLWNYITKRWGGLVRVLRRDVSRELRSPLRAQGTPENFQLWVDGSAGSMGIACHVGSRRNWFLARQHFINIKISGGDYYLWSNRSEVALHVARRFRDGLVGEALKALSHPKAGFRAAVKRMVRTLYPGVYHL